MTVSQLFGNIPLLHCLNIFIDFDSPQNKGKHFIIDLKWIAENISEYEGTLQ